MDELETDLVNEVDFGSYIDSHTDNSPNSSIHPWM